MPSAFASLVRSAMLKPSSVVVQMCIRDRPNIALVSDNGQLFITGYSQGGYVAMATHLAMQAAGMTVTASAPLSGPYALAAFVDAEFEGEVSGGAPIAATMLLTAYQNSYGNIYTSTSEVYSPQYLSLIHI